MCQLHVPLGIVEPGERWFRAVLTVRAGAQRAEIHRRARLDAMFRDVTFEISQLSRTVVASYFRTLVWPEVRIEMLSEKKTNISTVGPRSCECS